MAWLTRDVILTGESEIMARVLELIRQPSPEVKHEQIQLA